MFIIISGPSGVGKNTVIEELLKRHERLKYLDSCTTRPIRENQIGKDYIHFTLDEMKQMIKDGQMFEYEEVHGNIYGTQNKDVNKIIEGEFDYIKDLGVLGQKYFVSKLKDLVKVVSIYLTCTKDEAERRLRNRGEINVEKRLERFDFEESHKGNFDYVIENINLNETVDFIEQKVFGKQL